MSVHAFIAYLRVEAQQEEERARVLRALAATIESGSTKDSKWWEQQTEGLEILSYRLIHFVSSTFFLILLLSQDKRAAVVKRKTTTKAKLPKLTAYTLFIQESFEALQGENHTMDHKDIISIAAHRWAQTTEEEKQVRFI